MKTYLLRAAALALLLAGVATAQVNSGSNGSDGALNPTANLVINMADHPDGIYHYTSVNIPSGVTVSFIPNAANTPVVWLVQTHCAIEGAVAVNGQPCIDNIGGAGGPGGYKGGDGVPWTLNRGTGLGPGGGPVHDGGYPGNASYGRLGEVGNSQNPPGSLYGSAFLVPLTGGSGGGGPGGGGGQGNRT